MLPGIQAKHLSRLRAGIRLKREGWHEDPVAPSSNISRWLSSRHIRSLIGSIIVSGLVDRLATHQFVQLPVLAELRDLYSLAASRIRSYVAH
jgi:hypothetical protein